jgi:seryl-tRNA synthetase
MSENKKVETKEVELTERQKYLQSQLNDLQNKENSLMFQLDQIKACQQVFNQAFIEESKEVSEKLSEE